MYSKSMHDIIDRLLLKDHRKRPSIEEILNLPSLQDKMKLYGYSAVSSEELKVSKAAENTTPGGGIKPYNKPTTSGPKPLVPAPQPQKDAYGRIV